MQIKLREAFTTESHEPPWIVEGIIPAGTMVLVAGDAGVGKTTMNLSEALHVALERPFLGHPTHRTRVLYLDEENSRPDLFGYLQQIWVGMGCPPIEDIEPWLRLEHFSLNEHWPAQIKEMVQAFQPGLIYIDTATSALKIKKEDDNAEASQVAQQLRYIMQSVMPHAAVKILKHSLYQNKGGRREGESAPRRTIRGAKCWLGIADQVMYHVKARAGRPRNDGLHDTILAKDKFRAWGLKHNIRITPSVIDGNPKGLILRGEVDQSGHDYLAGD